MAHGLMAYYYSYASGDERVFIRRLFRTCAYQTLVSRLPLYESFNVVFSLPRSQPR